MTIDTKILRAQSKEEPAVLFFFFLVLLFLSIPHQFGRFSFFKLIIKSKLVKFHFHYWFQKYFIKLHNILILEKVYVCICSQYRV